MNKKFAKIAAVATLCACIFGTVCFTACEGTPGKSAYDIWIEQGNTGTEQDFLNSLKGTPGTPGTAGKSAYQAWLDAGNTGSEQDFLDSLVGESGTTPEITISDDGYWEIDGVKTDQKAQGEPGDTPQITVSDDGYWEIDGVKTAQKAQGETGTRGNTITKGEGAPTSTEGAIENDMYVDTKEWHVYFFEGTKWVDYGSIKGKDGSDPKPTPEGTEIDIQANDEQTVEVNLAEGLHVLIVDMGTATLTTGKLQAQVGEQISEFNLSNFRSEAAGENHNVYCGFLNAKTAITTLTFKTTGEAVKGELTFEDYSAPTLKADGTYIEVPVTSYNNNANDAIEINLDSSLTAGSYNFYISKYPYSLLKVVIGGTKTSVSQSAYDKAKAITLSQEQIATGKIHFEHGNSNAAANTIWYTTVKLESNA